MKSIQKEPIELSLEGSPEESPELADVGCVGKISGTAQATPAGSTIYLKLVIQGRLARECGRCLEKLEDGFRIKANLLVEKGSVGGPTGIEWEDDEQQGVEDYLVRVREDVDELPLEHLVAEQIILNYDPNPLPPLDAEGKCVTCGRTPIQVDNGTGPTEVDPRWEKLKSLRKKPKE